MTTRFKTYSGCYTCRSCGKQTRATGHDEESCELCAFCYIESGLENTHSDNDGCSEYDEACPLCNPDRPSQLRALCTQYNVQPPKGETLPKSNRRKPIRGVTAKARELYLAGELTEQQIVWDHLMPMYEAAGVDGHTAERAAKDIMYDVKKQVARDGTLNNVQRKLQHVPSTIFFRGTGGGVR